MRVDKRLKGVIVLFHNELASFYVKASYTWGIGLHYSSSDDWSQMLIKCFHCRHYGEVDLMGLRPSPWDPSSFSAVTLLVGSFDL